jgi:hypothetical protein
MLSVVVIVFAGIVVVINPFNSAVMMMVKESHSCESRLTLEDLVTVPYAIHWPGEIWYPV